MAAVAPFVSAGRCSRDAAGLTGYYVKRGALPGHSDTVRPMRSLTWHNSELKALIPKGSYGFEDIGRIEKALKTHRTLSMRPFASGLFPSCCAPCHSSETNSATAAPGVRDNVFVAYAYELQGKPNVAARTARALFDYFWAHRQRFETIIARKADPSDVMQRPQIRFDGKTLQELPEPWPHAQNDALGYALWPFSRLAARRPHRA